MERSRVSVDAIVVAFHGDRWLGPCVAFIRNSTYEDVRVVIADNFGNTTIPELTDGRHIVSVKLEGPLGFAESNNLALVATGFEAGAICFLNQDTVSPVGWLTHAGRFLSEHSEIGALTPLISTYDGGGWDENFRDCTKSLPSFWNDLASGSGADAFYEAPVIPAPAMVVRTDVLRQVGGFDPIFGSYYEDYDLCLRIRRAGYRVGIWTGATVAHFSGSATRTQDAELRRQRLIVRNRVIYRIRSADQRRLPQLAREVFQEMPRQFARRLLGRRASKPLSILLGGYWDLAQVLPRLVSVHHDRRCWDAYLREIRWPQPISTLTERS